MREPSLLIDLIMSTRPQEIGTVLKCIFGVKRKVETIEGYKFWIDPASSFGYTLLKDGIYEPQLTEIITQTLLEEGDTFIDVGANEGWFSVVAGKKVGSKGRIISIEPRKSLCEIAKYNFQLNSLQQCTIIPVAIGKECTHKEILVSPSTNIGASTFVPTFRSLFYKKEKVEVKTLDWIYEHYRLENVKVMKIDIEGYELFALQSASNILSLKKIANIFVEIHPAYLKKLKQVPGDIYNLMKSYGYKVNNYKEIIFFSIDS